MNIIKGLTTFNNFIWGFPLLILLVGSSIYLTFRLRFLQVRKVLLAFKYLFVPHDETGAEGDVSSFHALAIALAGTVGTGNIIGVALAIKLGGAGALFWMWLTGLFGMATKYAETMLSVKYRIKDEMGQMSGGPMYVLERGLNRKTLAKLFAVLGVIASMIGSAIPQSNTMVDILEQEFRIVPFAGTVGIGLITAYITLGGVKRISRIAGIVIPFVAGLFIFCTGLILLANIAQIPAAIMLILHSAFDFDSISGGFIGSSVAIAINQGVRRGVFSNEFGNGTSPIAAATAITHSHVRQGLINMLDVFIDTHIVNFMMGLMIIISGAYEVETDTLRIVTQSFEQVEGVAVLGNIVETVCLMFFSFTTVIAWNYYGERCAHYLMGYKIIPYYKVFFVISIMVGGVQDLSTVFMVSDLAIALMVIPNIIGIILLSNEVIDDTRAYFSEESG